MNCTVAVISLLCARIDQLLSNEWRDVRVWLGSDTVDDNGDVKGNGEEKWVCYIQSEDGGAALLM